MASLAGCDLPSQAEENPEPPKEVLPRNGSSSIPFYTETVAKRADGVSDRMRAINRTRKFLREQKGYFIVTSSKTNRDPSAPFEYKSKEIDLPTWIENAPVDTITYVFTRTNRHGEVVKMAIARVPNVPEIKQLMGHWLGGGKRSGSLPAKNLLPAWVMTDDCLAEYQDPRCIDNEQYYDPDLGSYVLCEIVVCDTAPDPDDELEGDGGGGFPGSEDWGDFPPPNQGGGNPYPRPPTISAEDFDRLNAYEKALCSLYPDKCIAYIAEAFEVLTTMYACHLVSCYGPAYDGSPHNAIQHGIFAGRLALKQAFDQQAAVMWTDGHEYDILLPVAEQKLLGKSTTKNGGTVPSDLVDKEFQSYMDAYNNRAAIAYAMTLKHLPESIARAMLENWVIDNVVNNTGVFRINAFGPHPGYSPFAPGTMDPSTQRIVPGSINWTDLGWNTFADFTFPSWVGSQ